MDAKRIKNPRKSLNPAFLKMKPQRSEIEKFKTNLTQLIDNINENESEEFNKNVVSEFLKKNSFEGKHFINTKDRNDLVIHNGNNAKSTVGVIIETKKPSNVSEMIKIGNLNGKAFQELILYYLRERITAKNLELKYLVATNIYEWFIFDAHVFEKYFGSNSKLVKQFSDFENKVSSGNKTDFFYKEIAATAIEAVKSEIEFTHFDIRNYEEFLRNNDKTDDSKLIPLFKLFSPEHFLKLPFQNDSNTLNKSFYSELLHIIGLTEIKDGGKKLIQRKKDEEREKASLLENSINQLENLDKISRLNKAHHFGETNAEQLFNVSLELVITWINRILFLKLLEAQLLKYHKNNKSYEFLSKEKIKNFDDLNELFFSVLAKKQNERDAEIQKLFASVPYLNSSLFEPTELEHNTLFISQLKDGEISIFHHTVLKDISGKKKNGKMNALQYLFEFLNSFDFSSEGSEDIQEENKTLINASVLGLIFEKINGYKDGSFFTPGFITMYMCRETIRKAVVGKFNETKKWNCKDLNEIFDKIDDKKEANSIINSLKICDPAVGSGHFLVSALNEIIAIKSELKVLLDRSGKTLRDYNVEVVNDELIVVDDDGDLFEYNPANKESQRIQEALFHEKQTIIENCLFGVDINSNSVKICRLRLWIELLKNAYYKPESNITELETLPNIDINIKCGNSLISRYALDADIKDALKKSKYGVDSYRVAVMSYRNADSKEQKRRMEKLIEEIKGDFESKILVTDKRIFKLNKLKNELLGLTGQVRLFGMTKVEKATWDKKVKQLNDEVDRLETEIEEIRNNKIYENAFEWRFEFPEVLNDDGDFNGFDVVIGNPPYIRQEEISNMKSYLKNTYQVFDSIADIYVYFVERGASILKKNGTFIYILPNKWMRAKYGSTLRNWVKQFDIEFIVDFGDLPVFEEATTYPCIWSFNKKTPISNHFAVSIIDILNYTESLEKYVSEKSISVDMDLLSEKGWNLVDDRIQNLMQKIRSKGKPLGECVNGGIYYGIKTALNEAFVIDTATKDKLIAEDHKSSEVIKPYLLGKNIKKYQTPESDKWLILFPKGFTIKNSGNSSISDEIQDPPPRYGDMPHSDAWSWIRNNYPAIARHLIKFKDKAQKRTDKGDFWWELRACDYYSEFEKPKIVYPNICKQPEFTIDWNKFTTNQKCFIISNPSLYLLGVLNSSVIFFLFKQLLPKLRGDFYEPSLVYFRDFPIPEAENEQLKQIEKIVSDVINEKRKNPQTDTTFLEKEIDEIVYELYGLNKEEIRIVEGK